jgi:hypothetical protein
MYARNDHKEVVGEVVGENGTQFESGGEVSRLSVGHRVTQTCAADVWNESTHGLSDEPVKLLEKRESFVFAKRAGGNRWFRERRSGRK